ncbi:alpha/beta fold hydrolase [Brucella intermedia]|uniref:alpha/beta fold hydrolase n=1 Tax=Brucella intermedia TaxID=94625 RepID=UPI00235EE065|nr:alpha/beta hydrolase [Brucella intermedia]
MRLIRKLKRKIRWHIIDIMARLGIGSGEILRNGQRPAYGTAKPKLLTVTQGDESFDTHDVLHGSFSSPEQCSGIPNALWADIATGGECIRYYPAGLSSGHNPVALLFFPGDIILRTARGVRFVGKSYTQQTPNRLIKLMSEWAVDAGTPAIYIARPGIFGSSGDHEKRRLPYEIELMDRTLDMLKTRHRIDRFVLVGQSGGAQIAAALLNRRPDIAASVMTAGLLSVHQTVSRWRRVNPVPGGATYAVEALYDPIQEVEHIRRAPAPKIVLISDPRDTVMPLHSQVQYLRRLQAEGFEPVHIYAHAEGHKHHNLGVHGRKAAALLVQGKTEREIRKALVDLDATNIAAHRTTAFPLLASAAEN